MTVVSIHMTENTGVSGLTIELRKTSDGTIVNTGGDSLSESPSSSGRFVADVSESWSETLAASVKNSGGLAVRDGWLAVGETIIRDSNPVPVVLSESQSLIAYAVCGSGSTTTSIVTSSCTPPGAVAEQFKNRSVVFRNNTATASLRGVAALILGSSAASNPILTVSTLPASPASGDVFVIT